MRLIKVVAKRNDPSDFAMRVLRSNSEGHGDDTSNMRRRFSW